MKRKKNIYLLFKKDNDYFLKIRNNIFILKKEQNNYFFEEVDNIFFNESFSKVKTFYYFKKEKVLVGKIDLDKEYIFIFDINKNNCELININQNLIKSDVYYVLNDKLNFETKKEIYFIPNYNLKFFIENDKIICVYKNENNIKNFSFLYKGKYVDKENIYKKYKFVSVIIKNNQIKIFSINNGFIIFINNNNKVKIKAVLLDQNDNFINYKLNNFLLENKIDLYFFKKDKINKIYYYNLVVYDKNNIIKFISNKNNEELYKKIIKFLKKYLTK